MNFEAERNWKTNNTHNTQTVSSQNEHIKHIQVVTGWSQTLLHVQSHLAFQKQHKKKASHKLKTYTIVTQAHKQKKNIKAHSLIV